MTFQKISFVIAVAVLTMVMLLLSAPAETPPATQPATQPITDDQAQMKTAWDDLVRSEPFCTKALLDMSAKPDAAVTFLKENLKPLKLDQADLARLIKDLGSDDERVWKPAFETLKYLDPRLAGSVEDVLEAGAEQPAHNRLIAVFVGGDADRFKDQNVSFQRRGNDSGWFQVQTQNGGSSTYSVNMRVPQLDVPDGYSRQPQWRRADRAVVLLQHIGTPAATAILKEMASGNPDALPTKLAKLAVKSLTEPTTQALP